MEIPFIYKYKPNTFDELEGDQNIINILKTLITMNNLNILFIGDSGSGKTTIINVLLKEYFGDLHFSDDVLEINCLKDQGIQFYRTEVKTFCQTKCSIPKKKKVLILDDIDNINEQSQQVFRNCIDKYNNNVHFICSCSSIQKVLDSLQSRQIIIKLKKLNNNSFNNIYEKIKKNEKIIIEKQAEKYLLTICNESIRILLNYMEKFKILNEKITLDIVDKVCSNVSFSIFRKYTNLIMENKLQDAIDLFYTLYDKGYSVMDIYDNYFLFIKTCDIVNEEQKYEIIKLLCKYITIFHNIHEDEIELAFLTNNLIKLLSN
tara:strand:- start:5280 stop:6233 length:954 start_codon:yes stop_codon:yes gene_type:complete